MAVIKNEGWERGSNPGWLVVGCSEDIQTSLAVKESRLGPGPRGLKEVVHFSNIVLLLWADENKNTLSPK